MTEMRQTQHSLTHCLRLPPPIAATWPFSRLSSGVGTVRPDLYMCIAAK